MEQEEQVKKEETKSVEQEEREIKRFLLFVLFLLFVAIIGLTIAFIKITSELGDDIIKPPDGPVTPVSPEWKVGFVAETSKGVPSGNSIDRINCGSIVKSEVSAVITDVKLLPTNNSRCSYPLTIKNSGTLDAKVSEIIFSSPNGVTCKTEGSRMTCGNITYKVSVDQNGNDLLSEGAELKTESEVLVYLIVEATGNNSSFNEISQSGAKIILVYAEA